jgi:hypothetical protein
MAQHIQDVKTSGIPQATKETFYARAKSGMPIFCQGRYAISRAIEDFTNSPFSHVGTLIYIKEVNRWGVIEATKEHGVHIGHLSYYTDVYDGDIVLATTPALLVSDYEKLLAAQFDLLDDRYDIGQELSMVAHKLLGAYPISVGKREFFCSGLYEQGRKATSLPLEYGGPGMASPEQVWTDTSLFPVCALVKGCL